MSRAFEARKAPATAITSFLPTRPIQPPPPAAPPLRWAGAASSATTASPARSASISWADSRLTAASYFPATAELWITAARSAGPSGPNRAEGGRLSLRPPGVGAPSADRQIVVEGQSGAGRVDLGGRMN